MSLASGRVRRLEKEAILRSKEHDYKREQSSYLITNSYRDEEDDEIDRHRRNQKMRQTRQIQREIDRQVNLIDKMNERRKQETEKKQNSIPPMPSRDFLRLTCSSNKTIENNQQDPTERALKTAALIEKYTNKKHPTNK